MGDDIRSIAVVGSGYVGTVVAACLAKVGHRVVGIEINQEKLALLKSGTAPFYEPGLDEVLEETVVAGSLRFSDDYDEALAESDIVFLCVDTPPSADGHPDMQNVEAAARSIGRALRGPAVLVTKSTVPVGSGHWLESVVQQEMDDDSAAVTVVSNPEFLREGEAVRDFLYPDRIVLGGDRQDAIDLVEAVYEQIITQEFPGGDPARRPIVVKTSRATAETVKYAANAFLATKISFINEMAAIAERVGADVADISTAIGLDHRIGSAFLRAGVGWGGSCFGKDLAALSSTAREYGYEPQILEAVRTVNDQQRQLVISKLQKHLRPLRGARITLLGLAFKPNTDDTRDAPAITIARSLAAKGAIVRAYDPMVKEVPGLPDLKTMADPYTALEGADAAVIVTEWPEFADLDFAVVAHGMRAGVVLDGRGLLDPKVVRSAGLVFEAIGKPDPSVNGNGW